MLAGLEPLFGEDEEDETKDNAIGALARILQVTASSELFTLFKRFKLLRGGESTVRGYASLRRL